jgi:hypothetical protein
VPMAASEGLMDLELLGDSDVDVGSGVSLMLGFGVGAIPRSQYAV